MLIFIFAVRLSCMQPHWVQRQANEKETRLKASSSKQRHMTIAGLLCIILVWLATTWLGLVGVARTTLSHTLAHWRADATTDCHYLYARACRGFCCCDFMELLLLQVTARFGMWKRDTRNKRTKNNKKKNCNIGSGNWVREHATAWHDTATTNVSTSTSTSLSNNK